MSNKTCRTIGWSKEELKIVMNNTIEDCVKLLPNKTYTSITSKRSSLGKAGVKVKFHNNRKPYKKAKGTTTIKYIKSKEKSNFFWTKKEDSILKTEGYHKALELITTKKPTAIASRANKLGISTKRLKDTTSTIKTTNLATFKASINDLNFVVNGVEIIVTANMTKKVLVNKNRIEILSK